MWALVVVFFSGFGLADFAPLTAAVQFPEWELLLAVAALAFDFGKPFVCPASEPGNVGVNLSAVGKANNAVASGNLFDGVALLFDHDVFLFVVVGYEIGQ